MVCGHALPLRLQPRPVTCARAAWACAMGCIEKSSTLWSFWIWLAKNMQIWIRIILIKNGYHRFNQSQCFCNSAVLFGIFNAISHQDITALSQLCVKRLVSLTICWDSGLWTDLQESQIVRVETTASLGIVRQCCVVHRLSCRRCRVDPGVRVDWGFIFITSYPPRHQARPQLAWKMSPSRTSALAHWCTTLVSSQGMFWWRKWPRIDVWMNAKGTSSAWQNRENPKHKTPAFAIPQEVWCLGGALF